MPSPPSNYIRVDNSIGTHPKLLETDDSLYLECVGLYVLVLGHCDRANSDGRIGRKAIIGQRGLAPGRTDLLDEMLRVGLLVIHRIHKDDLHVRDYLGWQRSKASKRHASDNAKHAADQRWDATRNAKGNAGGNAGGNAKGNAEREREDNSISLVTSLSPSLSLSKGEREGECMMCEGTGFVLLDDDTATACPDCKGKR